MFKKQGVAWFITIVMILIAIFIGLGKRPVKPEPVFPSPSPAPLDPSGPVAEETFFVYDDAGVLSADTEKALTRRNEALGRDLEVVIAVVTANYGRDDLFDYALDYAERIGLGGNDFIVVLDISGDNYWLVQGANLIGIFTDDDCSNYAWDYMERYFAAGDYNGAVLSLTEALDKWYRTTY